MQVFSLFYTPLPGKTIQMLCVCTNKQFVCRFDLHGNFLKFCGTIAKTCLEKINNNA